MADTQPTASVTPASSPSATPSVPATPADEAKIREDSLDQLARLLPDLQRLLDHELDQKIRDAVRAEFARQNVPTPLETAKGN